MLVDLSDNGFGQKLIRFDNTFRRSPYLDLCAGLTYEEHPIGSAQDRRRGHDTLAPRHLGTVDQPDEAAGINRLNHWERAPREPADLLNLDQHAAIMPRQRPAQVGPIT